MKLARRENITRNPKRNRNIQQTTASLVQTPRTLVPTPKRKHGVPPNVDIGHYIKLYYPGSRYHFGYPKCDVCNRATQEQYAVGEHRFCNFGCIVIYMDRIGGTAHNLLFDLAYLMEKGWSRRSMREVVLG